MTLGNRDLGRFFVGQWRQLPYIYNDLCVNLEVDFALTKK